MRLLCIKPLPLPSLAPHCPLASAGPKKMSYHSEYGQIQEQPCKINTMIETITTSVQVPQGLEACQIGRDRGRDTT